MRRRRESASERLSEERQLESTRAVVSGSERKGTPGITFCWWTSSASDKEWHCSAADEEKQSLRMSGRRVVRRCLYFGGQVKESSIRRTAQSIYNTTL